MFQMMMMIGLPGFVRLHLASGFYHEFLPLPTKNYWTFLRPRSSTNCNRLYESSFLERTLGIPSSMPGWAEGAERSTSYVVFESLPNVCCSADLRQLMLLVLLLVLLLVIKLAKSRNADSQ